MIVSQSSTTVKPARGASVNEIYEYLIATGADPMTLTAADFLPWVDGRIHTNAKRIRRDIRNKATAAERLARKRKASPSASRKPSKRTNYAALVVTR